MAKHSVFENAKLHIKHETKHRHTYHFVSPVAYNELDALCNRARTSRDVEDFVAHQLTNKSLNDWWEACRKYFHEDERITYSLISNCYFDVIPNNLEETRRLERHLSYIFSNEDASHPQALIIMKNYINEEKLWGKPLTASDVIQSLEQYGLRQRIRENDPRILPEIHRINRRSRENYPPIGGVVFPREETSIILEHIHNGRSTLLLGRAGSGKSGCLQELMQKLDEEGTLFLSLALDRFPSEARTAAQYGKSFDLPDSPVLCMHRVSGGKPVVILLDQLDSLRWMNGAAANALDACKDMIEEACILNQHEGGHISIVFATRRFDYETDPGIKGLFVKRKEQKVEWSQIDVDTLSEEMVRQFTGEAYPTLPPKLRELLKVPANLYIWLNLDGERRNHISSLRQLIDLWWREIQQKCRNQGADVERIDQCRNKLIFTMQMREQLFLPLLLIEKYRYELDLLCSFGVLTEENEQVRFAHQSFFDYFSVSRQIVKIYDSDRHISDFYPGKDGQTLDVRYQALMLLQYLMDADIQTFYGECVWMLQADDFRFYFQCCVFDVLGQLEKPDGATWKFLQPYLHDEKWRTYILRAVFFAHPPFIRLMFEKDKDFKWRDEEGRILLRSIMERGSDLAIDIIEATGIDRFTAEDLFDILRADQDCKSARGFELRKALIRNHAELLRNDFDVYHMIEQKLPQAVDMLLILVEVAPEIRETLYLPDEKGLYSAAKNEPVRFAQAFIAIPRKYIRGLLQGSRMRMRIEGCTHGTYV